MLFDTNTAVILLAALILDALIGDPNWIWRRIPHPVAQFGFLIETCDRHLNQNHYSGYIRRLLGFQSLAILIIFTGYTGFLISTFTAQHIFLTCLETLIVAIFLAQKSLYLHGRAIVEAYTAGGIVEARKAVSMIVGRNTENLDEISISRATIESLAENFSDGVIAPAFWYLLAGLPGLVIYKLVNTADSMIGYKTDRHGEFGWAAARLDDLLNFIPARLSGFLICLAAMSINRGRGALITMLNDHNNHRSPNAGWPEAAMAGSLDVSLAGPRTYHGAVSDDTFVNSEGRKPEIEDIENALSLLQRCFLSSWIGCGLIAIMAL